MVRQINVLILVTLFVFQISYIQYVTGNLVNTSRAAVNYLNQYGYVDHQIDIESRSGVLDMIEFLKKFQNFFGLKITGKLDSETLTVMNLPRCGVPDFFPSKSDVNSVSNGLRRFRRYSLHGSSWPKKLLSWRVSKFSQRSDMQSKQRGTQDSLAAAFETWAAASQLRFAASRDSQKVDIDIRFEVGAHNDSSKFDGKGGTLAHAFFPKYGGAVHFDDDEQWVLSGSSGTHLQTVALHELGHSLGLSHSNVKGSVMYPTYAGVHVDLSEDDRLAIQKLYGAPASSATSAKPKTTTSTTSATHSGGNTLPSSWCNNFKVETGFCAAPRDCYFISGPIIVRLLPQGGVQSGFPKPISQVFYGINGKVDTVFRYDENYFVVQGERVFRYLRLNSNPVQLIRITDLFPRLPVHSIDAIYQNRLNKNVYIFKNEMYWNFHKVQGLSRSRPLTNWGNLPSKLDAIMDFDDQTTYMVKGDQYWSFNEDILRLNKGYPKDVVQQWLGCKQISRGTGLIASASRTFRNFIRG